LLYHFDFFAHVADFVQQGNLIHFLFRYEEANLASVLVSFSDVGGLRSFINLILFLMLQILCSREISSVSSIVLMK
jgi:hypothetical protein